jgi:16S rRNA G1207 methylase RsmC
MTDYPWSTVSTLCDVGSGVGGFALPLAKKFPSIQITLHDLPDTIEQAKGVSDYCYHPSFKPTLKIWP